MISLNKLISCKNRVAIITGASGHLGRLISSTLAEIGYHLILVDITLKPLELLSGEIKKKFNVNVRSYCFNLEIQEERDDFIKKLKTDFVEINCLVNNAAFVGTTDLEGWNVPFEDQSIESWRRAFEVNLTAPFHLSKSISPMMKNAIHPRIINVGSIYGHYAPDLKLYEGTEIHNIAAYASSKGGLMQLTRWLSTTLAPYINVNAISPGGIYRNQSKKFVGNYSKKVPLKRMATEKDFIGPFAFLSSDMSNYITGQNLKVDGGWGLS